MARGSTRLSCSTGMHRHIRETHGSAADETRTRRQAQQARRMQAHRAAESVVSHGHSKQHLFVVTCPLHRETMWLRTRDALVSIGIPTKNIIRRRGIHFERYQQNGHGLHYMPVGLKRSTFLMWDFHHKFLSSCSTWFEKKLGTAAYLVGGR